MSEELKGPHREPPEVRVVIDDWKRYFEKLKGISDASTKLGEKTRAAIAAVVDDLEKLNKLNHPVRFAEELQNIANDIVIIARDADIGAASNEDLANPSAPDIRQEQPIGELSSRSLEEYEAIGDLVHEAESLAATAKQEYERNEDVDAYWATMEKAKLALAQAVLKLAGGTMEKSREDKAIRDTKFRPE